MLHSSQEMSLSKFTPRSDIAMLRETLRDLKRAVQKQIPANLNQRVDQNVGVDKVI